MIMEKKPFVTMEQVQEMAGTYPTPFHLYDEEGKYVHQVDTF